MSWNDDRYSMTDLLAAEKEARKQLKEIQREVELRWEQEHLSEPEGPHKGGGSLKKARNREQIKQHNSENLTRRQNSKREPRWRPRDRNTYGDGGDPADNEEYAPRSSDKARDMYSVRF